jgi:hypothetical protein
MRTTRRTAAFHAFYWAGVAMAFACIAVVLVGNTEPVYRFEHTRFSLLWAFAGVTVIAFLAAELCIVFAGNDKPVDGSSQVPQAPSPAPAARMRRGPSSGEAGWQEESRRAEAGKSGVPA